jgi:hypothetical protein
MRWGVSTSTMELERTARLVYLVVEFDISEYARDGTTPSEWAPLVREWRERSITVADACAALHWHLSTHLPLAAVGISASGSGDEETTSKERRNQLERYCKHLMRKESPYVLEDLDPEEAARRARAREVYEKMYPLSTDDPYGEKRLERVQTPAGVKRAFNQVAREMGLGGLVDAPDAEQTRKLEVREIDRNAYRQPSARERCPRESRSRRRPGWVVAHFVLPRPIIEGLGVLAKACCEMVLPCECWQRRANE